MKRLIRKTYRRLMQIMCVRKNVSYASDLHVGRGSLIMAPRAMEIGKNVIIGMNAWIAVDGTIGDGVLISSYVGVVGKDDHNVFTPGKSASRAKWIFDTPDQTNNRHAVHIGDDVMIGFNACVLSGVTIGRGAIVGAKSLVVKDVPAYAIVAGTPAKQIGTRFTPEQIEEHEAKIYGVAKTVN